MGRFFGAGILYSILWYSSIVAGYLILTLPSFLILVVNPKRYRKLGDFVFSFWEVYATVLLKTFGVKVVVSGDHVIHDDSAILMMNHRTRTDWNFVWAAMYQACMPNVAAHRLKIILKDPVRHVPGPGWVMQMSGYIFITRHWQEDKDRMTRSLDYLVSQQRRSQILIFPEGTDLNDKSKAKSDSYAEKNGLKKYEYTLHPRTTGFSFVTNHLQKENFLDAIYDMTIGYPYEVPQKELDISRGIFPKEVHINIKRVPVSELPCDEQGLRSWIEDRWRYKEKMLQQFYRSKKFADQSWPRPKQLPLYVAALFWLSLTVVSIVLLIISPMFQLVTLMQSLFFVGLSISKSNFNQLEVAYYNLWKRKAKSN